MNNSVVSVFKRLQLLSKLSKSLVRTSYLKKSQKINYRKTIIGKKKRSKTEWKDINNSTELILKRIGWQGWVFFFF